MLLPPPLVITIVLGGAGCTKCSVIQSTASSSSRNGPYVRAASRQEMREILKRGISAFRTLAAREVGSPTRARSNPRAGRGRHDVSRGRAQDLRAVELAPRRARAAESGPFYSASRAVPTAGSSHSSGFLARQL